MPPDALLPDPRVAEAREQVKLLAGELARLLAERDELRRVVGPNLEADHRARIGEHLLENLRLECQAARLKRELELVQAALNRGEAPDYVDILRTLDDEFAAWLERLRAETTALLAARARLGSLRPAAESREFRQLYRQLVRRLHPDVNPAQPEAARHLWARVQEAHANGDLDELRALALLLDTLLPGPADDDAAAASSPGNPGALLPSLQRRADALTQQVRRLLAELAALPATWPFSLRPLLADPAWVATQIRAARERAAALDARCAALRAALNTLLDQPEPPAPTPPRIR